MIKVKRAQIKTDKHYQGGVDTTVRAQTPFSPSWYMVMYYKAGELSEKSYTEMYNNILNVASDKDYEDLLQQAENGVLTLLCYCRDDWFCHTHLLIKRLKEKFPDKVST